METSRDKQPGGRARRKNNGMAATAGISKAPPGESISRSVSLLRAALRVWEAKHGYTLFQSEWQRARMRTVTRLQTAVEN